MHKYILLSFILLISYFHTFSKDDNNDTIQVDSTKYMVFKPSHELNTKIHTGLLVRYNLIRLRVHPQMSLSESEYKSYSKLMDTIQVLDNVIFIDTISIILKNGISWNLDGDPPPSPKNFYFKIMTKERRKEQAVINRLKYLQFCYEWREENSLPREMVDKFVYYQLIMIDGVKYLEILYEIKYNPDKGTHFSKKEIMIRPDI